jgi:hypothetical protein
MASISAADVMKLRNMTNAPMMDCKAALEKAGGDFQKAIQILREQNKAISSKKAERETAEGRIGMYVDPAAGVAAIVEVRCETAPVVKSDPFIQLANDLARHVALVAQLPGSVEELLQQAYLGGEGRTVRDRLEETIGNYPREYAHRPLCPIARGTGWRISAFQRQRGYHCAGRRHAQKSRDSQRHRHARYCHATCGAESGRGTRKCNGTGKANRPHSGRADRQTTADRRENCRGQASHLVERKRFARTKVFQGRHQDHWPAGQGK